MSRLSARRFPWRRWFSVTALAIAFHAAAEAQSALPATNVTALDGHAVALPRDLSEVTVVIVGFSRASADATTAWEIPVRTRLANNRLNLYDLAILESVPGFMHGWVVHSLHGKVPPILQPRFLPVFEHEKEWKQVCGFDPKTPDAAYVLLTSRDGRVLWKTHDAYSASGFATLQAAARKNYDGAAGAD